MARPPEAPPPDGRGRPYPADCDHTHLFPGARVRVNGLLDPEGFAAVPLPLELALRFSDASFTDAELLLAPADAPTLTVAAYTTDAGTELPDRTWLVREFRVVDGQVEVVLGVQVD